MLTKLRRVFKSHPSAGPNLRSNAETLAASSPVHRTEPAAAAKDAENIQTPSSHWKNGLVDNAAFALDVVEKLAAFAQTVPFVAPVAGFLSQIVKVYNEVQDTHDKRNILLDRITNIAEDLYATIMRLEQTNHSDLIGRLQRDVEEYTRLLNQAFEFVSTYDRLGTVARGLARQHLGGTFGELQEKLDLFGARFRTNRLVDLSIQQSTMEETLEQVYDMILEERLEKWLRFPPDMSQKQHDTQKLRREGTGLWFLEGDAFIRWQDNAGTLWLQGPSGSGKTVLSSSIVRKLIDDQKLLADFGRPAAVAFFYFDFKAKGGQTVEIALRRIILQLSAQSGEPHRILGRELELSRGQTLPNYSDLLGVLEDLLRRLKRTYIVLDALDECQDSEHGVLTHLISRLQVWNQSPLHLLITSQPRVGFSNRFKEIPCVFLEANLTSEDIKLFIIRELRDNPKLKIWASRGDEIAQRIAHKSSGMFRLAACLLVELSHCKRKDELAQTLKNLPNDLFGIYDRFLGRIRPQDLVYATGVLRWLAFSFQPLTLDQIADAISFDFSKDTGYTYTPILRDDNIAAIPDWCEGIATVREDSVRRKILALAHASVEDYLLSPRFAEKFGYSLEAGRSHTFIARTCIGYLLHFAEHPLTQKTLPKYPLAKYAADHWCRHLLRSHDQNTLTSAAMHLLQSQSDQFLTMNILRGNFRRNISPLRFCLDERYIEGMQALLRSGVVADDDVIA